MSRSKAQSRWAFANKPAMAQEFADKTPDMGALPEKVAPKKRKRRGPKPTRTKDFFKEMGDE